MLTLRPSAYPDRRRELEPLAAAAEPAAAQSVGTLPTPVDLVLYRGDDFYLDIAVTDAGGGPLDLTGYTVAAEMRPTADATELLGSFTPSIAGNVITLHLTATQAALLVGNTAVWDVQIKDAAGVVVTLAYGSAAITGDVSRPA